MMLGAATWGSWAVPAVLVGLALLLLYLYGTWTLTTWSRVGVTGPPPSPFLGNMAEINQQGMTNALLSWCGKYGKVYGMYFMRQPVLMTTDLDILKEVFIKDFRSFSTRGLPPAMLRYPSKSSLVFVNGETWRRQRHTLTPVFSTSKLRLMGGFVSKCCANLADVVHTLTDEGTPLDVKKLFGAFTLDVIAGTGFGLDTNSLVDNHGNLFLDSVARLFASEGVVTAVTLVTTLFPALAPLLLALGVRENRGASRELDFITHTIRQLADQRRAEKSRAPVDMLQLMLDAEATEADIKASPQDKRLSTSEVVAQGVIFFLAGYETTATTLQYLIYLLALHPDTQDKLYQEIVAAVGDADPSYDNVSTIPYLESCIYETLRLYPSIVLTGRRALETRTIKGVTIPAGTDVFVPICGLLRDEDIFPDADKFLPERFENEHDRIPSIVKEMAFGAGPRQCIGLRLALYEIKMVMVTLIRKFKFIKVKETPETITLKRKIAMSSPDKPLMIGSEHRR